MSVAGVHGGGACGARFSMFAGTASCDPMAPPLNTALAGTNFGSDPTPIEGRPSGLGHASVVTCRVCVRVCVAHADKNTRFVCTSGDPAAAYPRHLSSGLDTHGDELPSPWDRRNSPPRGRTPLPIKSPEFWAYSSASLSAITHALFVDPASVHPLCPSGALNAPHVESTESRTYTSTTPRACMCCACRQECKICMCIRGSSG